MKRRELLQTILLSTGAVVHASPVLGVERPASYDASKDLLRPDWKPSFLDEHQDQTLIALSDLIIPATDTPGAKDALVNRFLDKLMAAEKEDTQREFLAGLAYIDGESIRQHRMAFVYLPKKSQLELLRFLAYPHSLTRWGEPATEDAAYSHFQHLKQWISSAYYSSEIGLRELGWNGDFPHGELSGCEETHRNTPSNGSSAKA
jgi:hypothetical protein